jgi:catechol 2,3-dioxygenase-like lactoylglutathione lyase family enzyme
VSPALGTVERMTIQRMDHVGLVVEDLAAATAFFLELGLELEGEASVGGDWVDRIIGLEGVRSDIVMLRTPDGHGAVELSTFRTPPSPRGDRAAPANAFGLRHLAFAVDDLDAVLAGLRTHGVELVGEVQRYEDSFLLCYVRGPEGVLVELAQQLH